ncbi:MAG: membrane lipoprotein lipid attachment site-containing protein [Candidatus Omnitrophica bacterium]|nr:membrane lipoprotein lipid attachment site-containing protein [Candidatus Omnitrophota bacterium]MBU1996728.1 membrane lipoprotein lipid attachment site-containing protein [Candidatus Omnitrophota bacterium]MBU4334583.1 membrane lipoprotein lipid attachment site-containing protein [Candidatus Omnitrophota bacterium]
MKKIILVICFMAIITGCAWLEKEPTDSQNHYEAQNIVNEMLNNYKNYIPGDLDAYISNDFTPNKYEYLSNVSRSAAAEHVLEFSAVTYSADRKDDTLTVKFKWNKKRNKYASANVDILSGATEFIFRNYKKHWMIVEISGEDPFIN